ncbi:MAG: hypothetical protein EB015_17910, partial [Methylocystaceae bacterium]|nr:hypothetical protein [Methylocystaceae bacterium]
ATAEVKLDSETKAYLRLWSAVVSVAIRDACMPPILEKEKEVKGRSEKKKQAAEITAASLARRAMYFLFDQESDLDMILDWLDIDVTTFRKQLLKKMYDDNPTGDWKDELTDMQRRNFRLNYQWFQKRINIGLGEIQ